MPGVQAWDIALWAPCVMLSAASVRIHRAICTYAGLVAQGAFTCNSSGGIIIPQRFQASFHIGHRYVRDIGM